jgi:hypothetical protein
VIPAVLGGALTTDRVCADCNRRAGVEIDQPFVGDWLVGWSRILWDVRDDRRRGERPPPIPDEELTLPDGSRVRLLHDGQTEIIPRVERYGDEISISVGSDDELNEVIKKITERAARNGKTLTPGEIKRRVVQEVAGRIVIDGTLWLRATTKMALAAASLVLPEEWLSGSEATTYRSFLWDENPVRDEGGPATAFPTQLAPQLAELIQPPEHVIVFSPSRDHVNVVTVLFGSLTAGSVQFSVTGRPPQNAWVLDPRTRSVRATTLEELITPVAVRRLKEYETRAATDEDGSES